MAVFAASHMACAFGILGNIVSFLVYLAPLPTFYRIYKKKSTEGFQSVPYAVALFSAMLLLYYAFLKPNNGTLLITINSVGVAIEGTYLLLFLIYATKEARTFTTKLLIFFNVGACGLIIFCTLLFSQGSLRVTIVGWICAVFSLCVFAAPLSIMRLVIKTKSVEYMPFALSFFLTLCATMWFFYGFLIKDFYIAAPNVLGFSFGIAQMVLYIIYRDSKKQVVAETKQQDLATVIDVSALEEKLENLNAGPEDIAVKEDIAMKEEIAVKEDLAMKEEIAVKEDLAMKEEIAVKEGEGAKPIKPSESNV